MQSIDLLSNSDSYPAFDVANFPACILALTTDSVTSSTVLTDLVNGVVFTATAGTVVDNGDGTFTRDNAGVFNHSAFATFGTDDGMLVVVGTQSNSDKASFGDLAGFPILEYGTAGGFIGINISNNHAIPTQTASGISTGCGITAFDNSANTGSVNTFSGGTYEADATSVSAGSLTGTWGNTTANKFKLAASTVWYGIYLMKWTAVPDANEIKRAAAWMAANPTRGLYPGWLYKT